MQYGNNYYINTLFATLIAYTAYVFLWTRFGLGLTLVVQYILLCLILIGASIYLIKSSHCKNSWVNWLIMIWLTQMLAFYLGDSSATTQFKESTFVLLTAAPIISMRYNPKHIKWMFIIMGVVSICMYFVTMSMMRQSDENSYGGGYLILVALPVFLYFFRDKSIRTQLVIAIVIFIMVLISMKRGDILACAFAIVIYFFIKLKGIGKFNFRYLVALIITVIVGYMAFKYLLATNDLFAWRFEQTLEGDSSERDYIYSKLWNHYLNAPLDVQLFGGGFDATLKIAEIRAHSDLLEVLSCEGVIGLVMYMGAFFSLFKQFFVRMDVTEKAILAAILAIWLVKMVFSMFIFSQPTIILFALTAYILNNRINKQYEY